MHLSNYKYVGGSLCVSSRYSANDRQSKVHYVIAFRYNFIALSDCL